LNAALSERIGKQATSRRAACQPCEKGQMFYHDNSKA